VDRLTTLREQIDTIDEQLADLIADRLARCSEVARVKAVEGLPMMQPARVTAVCDAWSERGRARGIDPGLLRQMARMIIDEACRLELDIMDVAAQRDVDR